MSFHNESSKSQDSSYFSEYAPDFVLMKEARDYEVIHHLRKIITELFFHTAAADSKEK